MSNNFIQNVGLYYHTLKYVKPMQLLNRVKRKIFKVQLPEHINFTLRTDNPIPEKFIEVNQSIYGRNHCIFLNEEGDFLEWNAASKSKLWLYNLHYFDDLNAKNSDQRIDVHLYLINDWIRKNPALVGNGWEPYPLSLRIVNWIKFFVRTGKQDASALQSLVLQIEALYQSLEYHLLGNHILANAKALVFAGVYFSGDLANKYLSKGLEILDSELDEQILGDGGNFELSPMYHNIVLVDLLDIINFTRSSNLDAFKQRYAKWEDLYKKMDYWKSVMTHPDGQVTFFNDTTMQIASTAEEIDNYARRLGLTPSKVVGHVTLENSGYSRLEFSAHSIFFDHGNIGPDYLPGHAHADSLSIEWSLGSERVLVNSGISEYGISETRLLQRKTESHNTVVVNDLDSSVVWSGFRVAQRAYAKLINAKMDAEVCTIAASHDGYARLDQPVIHTRTIEAAAQGFVLIDQLLGDWESAEAVFCVHPSVTIEKHSENSFLLMLESGTRIEMLVDNGLVVVENSTWHPQFGKTISNKKFKVSFTENILTTTFSILK